MPDTDNLALYHHLFNETLFILPEKAPKPAVAPVLELSAADRALGDTTPVKKYHLVGENKKGLVIVVTLPEPEFTSLPRHEFLSKILTAIKFGPADVAYLNLKAGEQLDVFQLSKETRVNSLIVFGQGLLAMSSDSKITLYKPAGIGEASLLVAEPLATIELDVNKKKWLWSGLQAIFLK